MKNSVKNVFNLENSSVFHSSNASNSHENHQNNHELPCYLTDSPRNSNENNENHNKSNKNSNKNSNNSQFHANSNTMFNNSKENTCLEQSNYRKEDKIHYRKAQLRNSQCNLLQNHDIDDSNNSSNQHKSSDDSYNMNYVITDFNEKNNQKREENEKFQKFDAFAQNYENNCKNNSCTMQNPLQNPMEMSQNYMNYPQNMQNIPICFPIQMNQSFANQMPFTGYQYGNGQMNCNRNMYINQQNVNNYEIVPNYMISQNPNNSFQLLQVGMSFRPVLMMPNETARNNMQFNGYFN